jgi:hypothetical protein
MQTETHRAAPSATGRRPDGRSRARAAVAHIVTVVLVATFSEFSVLYVWNYAQQHT